MIVVDGPGGNGIGKSIASILDLEFLECQHKIFADGESEVGIKGSVKGQDVLIVQSTYPLQDKRLQELYFLAHDAQMEGARSVQVVIPYLAYARQNKKYEGKNNAVSIDAVLKILNAVGITTLITVAPHNVKSLEGFKGNVSVVDVVKPLAEEVKKSVKNPFVLAPDKGALKIAEPFANIIGCDFANINKERDTITGKIKILGATKEDFTDKEVIIVDDMISTGETTVQAAKFAYDHGASRVIAAAVHLLMAGNAYEKITASGIKELYGTNTIPNDKAHIVDVSKAITKVVGGKVKTRVE